MSNYRSIILNELVPYARTNERLHLFISDMGFGVCDQFKAAFPDRVYNVGIMEQGAVGIAAGMAMTGLTPIVYSITNFLVYRALEQIRNDVVLQGLNVKFIATGANNYFKFLGQSHCCGQDDIELMRMIGLKVYDPYAPGTTADNFLSLVNEWILSPTAGYLRV